jgi:hypothetical protein
MLRRTMPRARLAAVITMAASLAMTAVPGAGASPTDPYETVVDHLRNPRGLDLAANGTLYVAEGGESGANSDPTCFAGASTEEGGELCGDMSSRISAVDPRTGTRTDLVTDLVSVGGPLFAIGASGVAVKGQQIYGIMGFNDQAVPPSAACGDTPACKALVAAAGDQLGHLLRAVPSGGYAWKQDVGAFNYDWTIQNKATIGAGDPTYQPGWANNPDFEPGDANPYGLTDAPGGTYMVDGGSNTLTWVPQNGTPNVVAAFPQPDPAHQNAYDAVPTCVTRSGGEVVVADLNGSVFVVDGSSLTVKPSALSADNGAFLVAAGGCAADGRGNVYISDIFAGSVVKVALGSMTMSWVRPPGTLNFPAGVAVAEGGWLYVANNSVCPSFPTQEMCTEVTGSIVRLHV